MPTHTNHFDRLEDYTLKKILVQAARAYPQPQRALCGILPRVTQRWLRVALSAVTGIRVNVADEKVAAQLADWLLRHGANLEQLTVQGSCKLVTKRALYTHLPGLRSLSILTPKTDASKPGNFMVTPKTLSKLTGLTSLKLQGPLLRNQDLLPVLKHLRDLQDLQLREQKFLSAKATTFCQLAKTLSELTSLDLSGTPTSKATFNGLTNMQQLRQLRACHDDYTRARVLAMHLEGAADLAWDTLGLRAIRGTDYGLILSWLRGGGGRQLTKLALKGTWGEVPLLPLVQQLMPRERPFLRELQLAHVDLNHEDLGYVWQLSQLTTITLNSTKICGIDYLPQSLQHLCLEAEVFTWTEDWVDGEDILTYHANLTSLELRGRTYKDEAMAKVAELSHLEALKLKDTLVSAAGLLHLTALTGLTSLSCALPDTKVLEEQGALEVLAGLTRLRQLVVSGLGAILNVPATVGLARTFAHLDRLELIIDGKSLLGAEQIQRRCIRLMLLELNRCSYTPLRHEVLHVANERQLVAGLEHYQDMTRHVQLHGTAAVLEELHQLASLVGEVYRSLAQGRQESFKQQTAPPEGLDAEGTDRNWAQLMRSLEPARLGWRE